MARETKRNKSQFKRDLVKESVLTESQVKDWCYHEPRRRRRRLLGRLDLGLFLGEGFVSIYSSFLFVKWKWWARNGTEWNGNIGSRETR